jgi:hypothetical protein
MENNTNKPQVLCIDFIDLPESGIDTRILIPQSGKLGERAEHLLGSLRKFGETLNQETLGDYNINVMKKTYDTLYAAEVSCETMNEFSLYHDDVELLICTETVTTDELTGLEDKIGGILTETTEALAESDPNLHKHIVKDAGEQLLNVFGEYWDSKNSPRISTVQHTTGS